MEYEFLFTLALGWGGELSARFDVTCQMKKNEK